MGNIYATGTVTALTSSDIRLKENVNIIENALEKINIIRGVTFDRTDEYINNNGGINKYFLRKNDVGVIAQEVEEILPEVVSERPDGFKAVKYEKMIPLLIQGIKTLYTEKENLRSRWIVLKKKTMKCETK